MSDRDAFDELVNQLRLLADRNRLRIIALLGRGEADVGTIIAELGKSQSFVSNHLRWLRLAGFVTSEHRGKRVVYRLVPQAIRAPLREVDNLIRGKD